MSIIEQAAKRLEELQRAGVEVPWAAAGLADSDIAAQVRRRAAAPPAATAPAAAPAVRPRASIELDLEGLARSGHLVPALVRSELAAEFRHIKRPLLRSVRGPEALARRSGLIAVTSALPGEGKTFSAINLAMSIAMEIDTSVLLVDADVVRPDLPRRLGTPPGRGLQDLLADPSLSLDDVVLDTNVPKLSLLQAGTSSSVAAELMASEAMGSLLQSLAAAAPGLVVVFDAPPLLVTNEAKVLASRVGQVVLVVEAERTPRSVVAAALAELEKCPSVMTMLNKCAEAPISQGYGYGY